MFEGDFLKYAVYLSVAVCSIIVAEAAYMFVSANSEKRSAVNRRVRLQNQNANSQKEAYIQLRKERGMDASPTKTRITTKLEAMHRQSAMKMPLVKFVLITTLIAASIGTAVGLKINRLDIGAALAGFLILIIPFFILRWKIKRRLKAFGAQLPEALDLITRGLKAGHPVPIAFSMVAREMPDPIGTEFGIMSDEITYGANINTAMQNLMRRVGHEDLPLFVTAVSIQSSTGGSLREVLEGLSNVIRSRAKLTRKIKAISTEGRMSAYILTAVPVLLALFVSILMPDYYGEVIHIKKTWYLIAGTVIWLIIGNAILFKMASFKA